MEKLFTRKELRKNIGMLFQGNALFDSLTVEDNVCFPLDMFSTLSIEEKKIKGIYHYVV